MRTQRRLAGFVYSGSCLLLITSATAVDNGLDCPLVSLQTVATTVEYENVSHFRFKAAQEAQKTESGDHRVTLSFHGPVLGSMDNHTVLIRSTCVSDGMQIRATLTRSENYVGAAAKNVRWQPRVDVTARARQAGSKVYVIWDLRSRSGAEIHRDVAWSTLE